MNILFVNNVPFHPQYGGIERVTDLLTKALIRCCHHNVYYLIIEDYDVKYDMYEYPAPLYKLPSVVGFEQNRKFVAQLVKTLSINVIINQRGQSATIHKLICGLDAKIISVLHSHPSAFIKYEMSRSLVTDLTSLAGKCKHLIKILSYPLYCYIRKHRYTKFLSKQYLRILEESSALVLLSNKYKSEFEYIVNRNISNYNILGIPNPNTFEGISSYSNYKDNIILYVGRLSTFEKAPVRLLQVWEKIHFDHQSWRLVFVGEGDAMDDMKKFVKRKRLPRVSFEGSQAEVIDYYKRASFICLTSNFEGWGMALTEGMQCGCIPFSFNSYGAASDIIDDGVNGCLIKPFDLNEYAARLKELMNNKELRMKMSLAACEKVELFNVNNVALIWDSLIKSVVK